MLLGLFLLIFVLLLSLLKFSVEFQLHANKSEMKSTLTVGVGRFRIAVPAPLLARLGEKLRKRPMKSLPQALDRANTALRIIDHLFQEVEFLQVEIWFGSVDPFWTALGSGGFWTVLGAFITALGSKPRFRENPKIEVHPNFTQTTLRLYLRCIFRFRLGQIIFSEVRRLGETWLA